MKQSIEQKLIDARPADSHHHTKFVDCTMQAIAADQTHETFESAQRTTSVTKKEHLFMIFNQLPRIAIISLILFALLSGGGAAYVAYRWLAPKATVQSVKFDKADQKYVYSVNIKNCGVVVGGTPISSGTNRFEVSKSSGLTSKQVTKVLENTCAYQALQQLSQAHGQAGNNLYHIKKGQTATVYGPNTHDQELQQGIGTVTAISASSMTLQTTIYLENPDPTVLLDPTAGLLAQPTYYPKGKTITVTYALAPNPQIWHNGAEQPAGSIHVGDTVGVDIRSQFIAQADEAYDTSHAITQVTGITKTDIDTAYVQMFAIGNPRYVNPITELVGCQHNGKYLCLSTNSPIHGQQIYVGDPSHGGVDPHQKVQDGTKYLRRDINLDTANYFYMIQGRITKIDNHNLTLKSQGKVQDIRLSLPYDILTTYNKNHSPKVAVGDLLQINYIQKPTEDRATIKAGDIFGLALAEYQLPDGSYTKY